MGYSNYLGDLVEPTFTFDQSSFCAGAFVKKSLSESFALRGNVFIGGLYGDDFFYETNKARNDRFRSTFLEISFMGEYDLIGQRRYQRNGLFKKTISPFVFAGLGIIASNPKVVYGIPDNIDAQNPQGAFNLVLPVGFGLKIDVNDLIYVGVEWGMRVTTTDYLDGVKLTGNADNNDVYFIGGVSATYRFADKKSDRGVEFGSLQFDSN